MAAARDVLTVLPEAGEAVHFLQTGFFDLVMIVPLLIAHYGAGARLRIATLSYNRRNLAELCRMLDSGEAAGLSMLTSTFFRNQEGAFYAETCRELRSRGCVVAAAPSHAKVITLDCAGVRLVVEGSANLRSNRSVEQVALIRDDGLYHWHASWIDDLLARHAGDGGGEEEG